MEKKIDRRKHPRVIVRALVDYESKDTFLYDYSKDLSEGGIFIETEEPLKVGETVTLKFSLPDVDKVFEVTGEVKWSNGRGESDLMVGMGVQFKGLDREDVKLIQEYIKKISEK